MLKVKKWTGEADRGPLLSLSEALCLLFSGSVGPHNVPPWIVISSLIARTNQH